MSTIEDVWANTTPGEFSESVQPPAGTGYVIRIADAKFFTSKSKGELTIAVEYATDTHQWSDVKEITRNGQPVEGKVKSAKILLRSLGVDENTPTTALDAALKAIIGRYYTADIVTSSAINTTTGLPYLNTEIKGPAAAPPPAPVNPAQQSTDLPWDQGVGVPQQQAAPGVPQPQPQVPMVDPNAAPQPAPGHLPPAAPPPAQQLQPPVQPQPAADGSDHPFDN